MRYALINYANAIKHSGMSYPLFEYFSDIRSLADAFDVPWTTAQSWVRRGAIPARYDARRLEFARADKQSSGARDLTAPQILTLLKQWSDERETSSAKA